MCLLCVWVREWGSLLHRVSTLFGSKNNVVLYPKQTSRNGFGPQTSADNALCGQFYFLWLQTNVNDRKNSEAKCTPQLVLTTKTQRGQRLENHIKPIIKPIGETHKTVKTKPFLISKKEQVFSYN